MESSSENSAVLAVLRRWLPELRKEAEASGKDADVLLDQALMKAMPQAEIVDISEVLAEAVASGFEPIHDLDIWQAEQEQKLKASLS